MIYSRSIWPNATAQATVTYAAECLPLPVFSRPHGGCPITPNQKNAPKRTIANEIKPCNLSHQFQCNHWNMGELQSHTWCGGDGVQNTNAVSRVTKRRREESQVVQKN